MNKRVLTMMILALAALLLAAGLTGAQPLPGKEAATYAMQPGIAAGGAYQLGRADWSVQGTAGGGEYRLDAVSAVRGTGTPCCCSHLPCLFR